MIARTRLWLYLALLALALLLMYLLAGNLGSGHSPQTQPERDYAQIQQEGTLRLLIPYPELKAQQDKATPTAQRAYRLAAALNRSEGWQVELVHEPNYAHALMLLKQGKVDAIAGGYIYNAKLDTTLYLALDLRPSHPLYLVQRSGEMALKEQFDLADQTIHLPRTTGWRMYVDHLSEELSVPIHVAEVMGTDVEQLIRQVASGKIDYTIATREQVQLFSSASDSLSTDLPITLSLRHAWLVRRSSPVLRDSLERQLRAIPN